MQLSQVVAGHSSLTRKSTGTLIEPLATGSRRFLTAAHGLAEQLHGCVEARFHRVTPLIKFVEQFLGCDRGQAPCSSEAEIFNHAAWVSMIGVQVQTLVL